jgi:hypothetical protein
LLEIMGVKRERTNEEMMTAPAITTENSAEQTSCQPLAERQWGRITATKVMVVAITAKRFP